MADPEMGQSFGITPEQFDLAAKVLEKIPLTDALPGPEILSLARGEAFSVPLDPDRVQGNDPQLVAAWAISAGDSIAPAATITSLAVNRTGPSGRVLGREPARVGAIRPCAPTARRPAPSPSKTIASIAQW